MNAPLCSLHFKVMIIELRLRSCPFITWRAAVALNLNISFEESPYGNRKKLHSIIAEETQGKQKLQETCEMDSMKQGRIPNNDVVSPPGHCSYKNATLLIVAAMQDLLFLLCN